MYGRRAPGEQEDDVYYPGMKGERRKENGER